MFEILVCLCCIDPSLDVMLVSLAICICVLFSSAFIPDLTARVCKTYSDCFDLSRELVTVYGGIVGLTSMGFLSIK